jgi:Neu-associated kinase
LEKGAGPHVIEVVDSVELPDHYALVLEDGGTTLYDILCKRKFLEESDVRRIARQLFAALAHLHSLEIMHGDVKLENIVIDDHEVVRLIDFGLSERIPRGTNSNSQCGSTFYRSPELLTGKPHTTKADIWALGIVLYTAVAGAFPFDSSSEYENFTSVLLDSPDMDAVRERVSPEFVKLIGQMLERASDKRPTAAECLEHPWIQDELQMDTDSPAGI